MLNVENKTEILKLVLAQATTYSEQIIRRFASKEPIPSHERIYSLYESPFDPESQSIVVYLTERAINLREKVPLAVIQSQHETPSGSLRETESVLHSADNLYFKFFTLEELLSISDPNIHPQVEGAFQGGALVSCSPNTLKPLATRYTDFKLLFASTFIWQLESAMLGYAEKRPDTPLTTLQRAFSNDAKINPIEQNFTL